MAHIIKAGFNLCETSLYYINVNQKRQAHNHFRFMLAFLFFILHSSFFISFINLFYKVNLCWKVV